MGNRRIREVFENGRTSALRTRWLGGSSQLGNRLDRQGMKSSIASGRLCKESMASLKGASGRVAIQFGLFLAQIIPSDLCGAAAFPLGTRGRQARVFGSVSSCEGFVCPRMGDWARSLKLCFQPGNTDHIAAKWLAAAH